MSYSVLASNGVNITSTMGEWFDLASKYSIPPQEIGLIDFNRTGVCLDDEDVRVGFRTRFNGQVLYINDLSWFALPVRDSVDSNFHIQNGKVYFNNHTIGIIDRPVLDTCDTSYQRGKRLLNLNSRSRSNCAGCKACVHNDKSLYDDTVIKDKYELITTEDIEQFFCRKEKLGLKIDELDQIAVVTGLFADEDDALNHMKDVHKVATQHGFNGELMYFGCQIMNPKAIQEFSELGNTAIVFAIENFTNREKNLSHIKSSLSMEDFYASMSVAKSYGVGTTFAYVAGVDGLKELTQNFEYFAKVCTRFPIVNIFQIQTGLQAQALNEEAKSLEFYVRARIEIERIFKESEYRPRRWENYRPLWYREFANELLNVKPYG